MSNPDLGRGGGYGTPEQESEWLEERRRAAEREIRMDRDAKRAVKGAGAGEGHPSWWRRLFRRS